VDDPNKDQYAKLAAADRNVFGVILKRGYIDLVALNCFVTDRDFVFYDQEYYAGNVPARAILLRTINFIYMRHPELKRILPKERLLARYDLQDQLKLYQKFSNRFIAELKNKTVLDTYRKAHQADTDLLTLNRQRMNYSQTEYERIFRDIFRNTEGRDLYLFGAGNYARKFISQFANDYPIAGLIDNNEKNRGQIVDGIEVFSSEILKTFREGRYKIIICIRNYVPVMKQLEELGLHNYSVYDWSLPYPRKARPLQAADPAKEEPKKKYHVGYVAGVFDLFHIGHVNLLRRAKELCDYLIVGVVTDEQVRNVKRTTPYMPFEDRIGIVRACRYVDEAVEIPKEYYTTKEAYRRYQFDVQFSGSDYENDPGWLKNREFLRSNGADLVFFPYTESTSSTKLKRDISDQQTNK
jgi:glycerol-3-phosphate cytidylyltransferase